MAHAPRGFGGIATGTTTVSPTYPSGVIATDRCILTVTCKPETVIPAAPSGWTLLGSASVGTGTAGTGGTGPQRLAIYERDATASLTGTVAVATTGCNVAAAQISAYAKAAGDTWATTTVLFGSDTTSATGYSATSSANLAQALGDILELDTAVSLGTARVTPGSVTAAGATHSAVTERFDAGSTTGNDVGLQIATVDVTGGAATAATTYPATLSAASYGGTAFVRLRVTPAPVVAGAATLNAPAVLTAAGTAITPPLVLGAATLNAASTLATAGTLAKLGAVALQAAAQLVVAAQSIAPTRRRPVADVQTAGWTPTGAATIWQALSDQSTSTYTTTGA